MHGADVEIEGHVPVGVGAFKDAAGVDVAGRIEQDVDVADGFGRVFDGLGVAHVDQMRFGDAVIAQALQRIEADVGGDHARAFACKGDGGCAADAGA